MPDTRRIAVLIGSLRADSLNRRLAVALAAMAPPNVVFHPVAIDDLPPYNQDHEARPPDPVARLKREIESCDALLFVSPEYNRSIPGVLKNAIDWASQPYGKNSFATKPAAIIGTTPGAIGTATMQPHLRNVLAYLDVPTLGQPEAYLQYKEGLIDADGKVTVDATRAFLQQWLNAALDWFEIVDTGRKLQLAGRTAAR